MQVVELTDFIKKNSDEQITMPIGIESKKYLYDKILLDTGNVEAPPTFTNSLLVSVDNEEFWISANEI